MRVRVAFATLGCKVNQSDTAAIRDALAPDTFAVVPFEEPADVYVINTCTVTATADRQARQLVGRAHRRAPAAAVLVTGCLVDADATQLRRLAGVEGLFENARKPAIVPYLHARFGGDGAASRAPAATSVYRPDEATRPPIKIQDGCAGHCAYCAVAAARGRPVSTPAAEVLTRLRALGRAGCQEAVLAGIDLGAWGADLEGGETLAALLGAVLAARPIFRVRLSSIEVHHLGDDVLDVLDRGGPGFCRHLHLPLQSGADAVLARMRRPYRAADYADRVRAARERMPDLTVGADVITGFPGETEADHRATLDLVHGLGVSYLHVFPFSPRPDTAAARFPDRPPPAEVKRRGQELRALGAARWRAWREGQLGRDAIGVVEGTRREGAWVAFTGQAIPVVLDEDAPVGRAVEVRLEALHPLGAVGRIRRVLAPWAPAGV